MHRSRLAGGALAVTPVVALAAIAALGLPQVSAGQNHAGHASHTQVIQVNPLLAPWTGPYRRRAAVRQGEGRPLQARARGGDGRAAEPRSTAIAADAAPPDFENTLAAMERTGRTLDRVTHGLRRRSQSTMNDGRVPGGGARDGAEARRLRRPDHPEREALRAHRRGLRRRASQGASLTPEQQRLAWLVLHQLRARRRQARRRGQEAALGRDQPAAGDPLHEVQPERARRRDRPRSWCSTRRPTSPACPSRCAPAPPPPPRRKRPQGQVGDPQHPLGGRAVPHLLRPSRPAREGLADASSAAATTATRTTTTRSSPRS